MSIIKKLETFVSRVFKTTLEIFLEALKLSPNAQGYISGSISELLLKNHLESLGYTVKRIREKWEGKKHPNHHGDFYFSKNPARWFVLESKGIKSNSEKWHKLYNYENLKTFLFAYRSLIDWIEDDKEIEPQIDKWIEHNLPKYLDEYSANLYDFEEIIKYKTPNKETAKSKAIESLREYNREQIAEMINNRLQYLMKKIKVLETHFVSGTGGLSGRTQATPRKDEFNIVSVDIFLRYPEHKFLFANPQNLESSGADANHLQQNYIIGFVFDDDRLCLSDEWQDDFDTVAETVDIENSISEDDMQIDNRNVIYEEEIQ